jgi:hypothetical protein
MHLDVSKPAVWILFVVAISVIATFFVVRTRGRKRQRRLRVERNRRNRAWQFGWDLVFAKRAPRLEDLRSPRDIE